LPRPQLQKLRAGLSLDTAWGGVLDSVHVILFNANVHSSDPYALAAHLCEVNPCLTGLIKPYTACTSVHSIAMLLWSISYLWRIKTTSST
jgi:hypothetical protein